MPAVVAQRVDIPPDIAVAALPAGRSEVREQARRRVLARQRRHRHARARMRAAPARYRPGSLVRAPGRSNDARQPCEAWPYSAPPVAGNSRSKSVGVVTTVALRRPPHPQAAALQAGRTSAVAHRSISAASKGWLSPVAGALTRQSSRSGPRLIGRGRRGPGRRHRPWVRSAAVPRRKMSSNSAGIVGARRTRCGGPAGSPRSRRPSPRSWPTASRAAWRRPGRRGRRRGRGARWPRRRRRH